jgi:hypothetical protein
MGMTRRLDGEARNKRRIMNGKSVFKRLRETSGRRWEIISIVGPRKVRHGGWQLDEAGSFSYPVALYCVDLLKFTIRG